ncbi:MAG: hypothetical protein ACOC3X_00735 [Nanoarchaeota archaeon]
MTLFPFNMEKQYKTLGTLIEEFGFGEAISHKFLEIRDRFPLANRLFTGLIRGHFNSSVYSGSYIAYWADKGNLAYFNPNPNYPEDFRPINPETFKPMPRLSDEELRERFPTEFAHTVSQILPYKK